MAYRSNLTLYKFRSISWKYTLIEPNQRSVVQEQLTQHGRVIFKKDWQFHTMFVVSFIN